MMKSVDSPRGGVHEGYEAMGRVSGAAEEVREQSSTFSSGSSKKYPGGTGSVNVNVVKGTGNGDCIEDDGNVKLKRPSLVDGLEIRNHEEDQEEEEGEGEEQITNQVVWRVPRQQSSSNESTRSDGVVWGTGLHGDALACLDGVDFRCAIPMSQVAVASKNSSQMYTNYCIVVQCVDADEKWTVKRRFEHFVSLHKMIKKVLDEQKKSYRELLNPLPRKRYFGDSMKSPVVNQRKRQLLEYLKGVLRVAEEDESIRKIVCAFLDINEDALVDHHETASKGQTPDHRHLQLDGTGPVLNKNYTSSSASGSSSSSSNSKHYLEEIKSPRNKAHNPIEFKDTKRGKIDSLVALMKNPIRKGWLWRQKHAASTSSSSSSSASASSPAPRLFPPRDSDTSKSLSTISSPRMSNLSTPNRNRTRSRNGRSATRTTSATKKSSPDELVETEHKNSQSYSNNNDDNNIKSMHSKATHKSEESLSSTGSLKMGFKRKYSNSGHGSDQLLLEKQRSGVTTGMNDVIDGYLVKQGGFRGGRKSWKKRYFQLRDRCLYYYKATSPILLGCMPLGDTTGVVSCMDSEQSRLQKVPINKFGFIVSTQDRELCLAASSFAERERWVTIIRLEMARRTTSPLLGSLHRTYDFSELETGKFSLSQEKQVLDEDEKKNKCDNDSASDVGKPTVEPVVLQQEQQQEQQKQIEDSPSQEQKSGLRGAEHKKEGETKREEEPGPKTKAKPEREKQKKKSEDAISPDKNNALLPPPPNLDDTISQQSAVNKDEERAKREERFKRQVTPPFPTSLKVDSEISNRRIFKEEETFDAPDLQQRDPWEVDWNQLEIKEKIGQGAFGQVYRGKLWGSEVAVKKLVCNDISPSVLRSLRKEVTILSQLRHPCVVLYIGACTQPPNVCMITEWCSRGSLYDVLHNSSILLDSRRCLDLALQVAKGMSYLHGRPKQIIHRDLKSHNVLITSAWQARVADFGLTIVRRKSLIDEDEDDGGHFGIQGTPQWMAPEVMEGNRYAGKVDVYSFGIMLTEIFTRKMPFADRYRGFDFVDAVLEGETPTIPFWACASPDLEDDQSEGGADSLADDDDQDVNDGDPDGQGQKKFQRRSKLFSEPIDGELEEDDDDDDDEEEEEEEGEAEGDEEENDEGNQPDTNANTNAKTNAQGVADERHPGNIQRIILSCLSRDPRSRPSFQEIVDKLNKLLENTTDDLLDHFDLPRLHEMLEMGTLSDASLAARELAKLGHRVQRGGMFPGEDKEHDEDESHGDYSSLSSYTNNKRQLLNSWVCPLVVRIVERLTRERDTIITTAGEKIDVHIPQRILAELGVSLLVLLQVCSADDGVTMQAANIILDQGALPVLTTLLLFSDAAQDFEKIKIVPSAFDHEAELEQILKNRNPDYSSLLQIGILLCYLASSCKGKVLEAVSRVLLDQLLTVDEGSHLSMRAKARCESAGIIIQQASGTIRYAQMTSPSSSSSSVAPWLFGGSHSLSSFRSNHRNANASMSSLSSSSSSVVSGGVSSLNHWPPPLAPTSSSSHQLTSPPSAGTGGDLLYLDSRFQGKSSSSSSSSSSTSSSLVSFASSGTNASSSEEEDGSRTRELVKDLQEQNSKLIDEIAMLRRKLGEQ